MRSSSLSRLMKGAPFVRRKADTNKFDYGHIFVLAGSVGFTGAAVLCANAAMRTGSGLVTIGIPKSLNISVSRRVLEVMTKPLCETARQALSIKAYGEIADFAKKADVLVVGPGLSRDVSTQSLVRKVIKNMDLPMVIDADGLNALVGHLDVLKGTGHAAVLTPHPGEFSRLTGDSVGSIRKNRETLAKRFSNDYNVVLVLKGHNTVVASQGKSLYINHTGNPGMATAGSGDVLAGMISSLLGQGLDAFSAAKIGVFLHGSAGDLAAREKTQSAMIASDIIEKIPEAIKLAYR